MKRANQILTIIAALLAVAVLASPSQATGCKVAVRRNVVVVQKQVVVAAVPVVALAAVPAYQQYGQQLYGATYAPDGLLEAFKLVFGQNQALISQNQTFLEQLKSQNDFPPLPGKSRTPPMPPADGGGSLADLTPDQNAAVISKIVRSEMPKGVKLSAEARLAMVDVITGGTDAEILAVFRTNCASCHQASAAKVKGGGFTLLK